MGAAECAEAGRLFWLWRAALQLAEQLGSLKKKNKRKQGRKTRQKKRGKKRKKEEKKRKKTATEHKILHFCQPAKFTAPSNYTRGQSKCLRRKI